MTNRLMPLAAALALLMGGCAHQAGQPASAPEAAEPSPAPPVAAQPTEAERKLSTEQRARLYYHILLAELAEARGQHALAQTNYLHAAKVSGRAELARRAAVAAQRSGETAAIEASTALWAELSPEEVDAQGLLTVNHLRRGDGAAAAASLAKLRERVRAQDGNLLRELMRIAESVPTEATEALYLRLADEHGDSEARLAAAHLALRLKHWSTAERQASAALAQEPAQHDALRLLVLALDAQKRRPEAVAAVEASLKGREDDAELVQIAGPLLQHLEQAEAARRMYEAHLARHPDSKEVHYALAGLFFDGKDYGPAREHFETVLRLAPESQASHYYLGQIAEQAPAASEDADRARALLHYRQVVSGRFYYDAQLQIARLMAEGGALAKAREQLHGLAQQIPGRRLDLLVAELDLLRDAGELPEARRLLAEAHKEFPGNVQLLLAEAQVASLEEDFDLTRKALEQALAQVDSPGLRKQLILAGSEVLRGGGQTEAALSLINRGLDGQPKDVDLLYARAILAESLGQSGRSEQDLRAILAQEPDNATALNALGYALADRNQRLTEAGELLQRAFSLSPDDPAVIDSMGWLHYRRGDLTQALEMLRRAYALNADPEIAAHLGEVLWQSGAKTEAKTVWNQALDKAPEHRVLKKVMERFVP
ncbi:MAG: tetratricopeptide repeat protein [Gammaproteobacteria bacterium]|nr:tetratricopeptide repeat protein [Gammaproteobacteria bacterium]